MAPDTAGSAGQDRITDTAAPDAYKQVWAADLDAVVNLVERLRGGGKWPLMPAVERHAFERVRRIADYNVTTRSST